MGASGSFRAPISIARALARGLIHFSLICAGAVRLIFRGKCPRGKGNFSYV